MEIFMLHELYVFNFISFHKISIVFTKFVDFRLCVDLHNLSCHEYDLTVFGRMSVKQWITLKLWAQ